jgi:hypothetical protein
MLLCLFGRVQTQDPASPGELGTATLRRLVGSGGSDARLMERSFALIFQARSVEITAASNEEVSV